MSINLHFKVKGGAGYVEFPVQTPTELTYRLINEPSIEKKLQILTEEFKSWGYSNTDISRLVKEAHDLFNSPYLEPIAI